MVPRCLAAVLATCLLTGPCCCWAFLDPSWPARDAEYVLRVVKTSGYELETEKQWMHLHTDGDPSSRSLGLSIQVLRNQDGYSGDENLQASKIQVRYTIMGVPVSTWLPANQWSLTLPVTSNNLKHIKDGVLDISLEVKGKDRMRYKPWPAFLHLKRGKPLSPLVPVLLGDTPNMAGAWVSEVTRISRSERRYFNGYPANPQLTPWSTEPHTTPNLYVELLTPGGSLFDEMQMWWEDLPSHPGLTFIRGLQPYQGEDPRGVDQARLPVQDGPRGVGWMSGYVQGKVDRLGRLAFAELAGRVGWLLPTGEIVTLAGWVTRRDKVPAWVRKPLEAVRANQELRGQGQLFEDVQGFGRPMDVGFSPDEPSVLYVPDLVRHCVWRLEVGEGPAGGGAPDVQVTLLAGSPSGESGYLDGPGLTALFNEPFSVAWAKRPGTGEEVLYVSDSANHAVRVISLATGAVTTQWGGPGIVGKIAAAGLDLFAEQSSLREALAVSVSAEQAAEGVRPDIYWPGAIRTDSSGNVLLLEHGFGQIRRLSPGDNTSVVLGDVDQKFSEYDHGWAWMDVDADGAAGPADGVYWCKAVGDTIQGDEGSHFNEVFAWTPKEGGGSRFIFTGRGGGANPEGFGERLGITPPHYPWLVAVDPRGGVLMTGMGVHGVSRMRLLADTAEGEDPVATEDYTYWLGQQVFEGPGNGRAAASLAYRFGQGCHNMLGLGLDGWATQGMKDNDAALLDYYGVRDMLESDSVRWDQLLAYLRKQTGPARDNLPTAPADTAPPTAPTDLTMAVGHLAPTSIILKWGISQDDRGVAGYQMQLARTARSSLASGPGVFISANAVRKYYNAAVGNTEGVLLEGLARNAKYHARLRAQDLGGKWSAWSAHAVFVLP